MFSLAYRKRFALYSFLGTYWNEIVNVFKICLEYIIIFNIFNELTKYILIPLDSRRFET